MVKFRFANFNSFLSYSVLLYPNEKCLTTIEIHTLFELVVYFFRDTHLIVMLNLLGRGD